MESFEAELRAAFEAELADHLTAIRAALADADAGGGIDLRDLSRRAHSLKGAARAVALPEVEALAHRAEAAILAVEQGAGRLDPATRDELRGLVDRIEDEAHGQGGGGGDPAVAAGAVADGRVRVSGDRVENLVRTLRDLGGLVHEQAVAADALEAVQTEIAAAAALAEREGGIELGRRLGRLRGDIERLRREQVHRQTTLDRALAALERDAEHIMLLPIATLFDGYERMVREIAGSQGKSATLRIGSSEGEADRRVLQALRDPLLHLLRNAVSHGIESPAERRGKGKPEQGEIVVEPRAERGRLRLTISDDGGGLDYRRIEARARQVGLIAADAPRPTPAALRTLLFEQGFSTAAAIDEVSGRGIGLSVVAETVRRLHGNVSIDATAAGGTAITVTVPLALSRQTLMLVEAGGENYCIPASAVRRLLRVRAEDVSRAEGMEMLAVDGVPLPLLSLAELVGLDGTLAEAGNPPALLVAAGDRQAILLVDALRDVRSVIVGDPTAIAADAPMVYGTALIEQGIALVLSPEALVGERGRGGLFAGRDPSRPERRQTVLVVDDSITTRTLEKSILEAQGYAVLIAVDGLEAIERLRSGIERIDLVVADVEMPRMDGFALLGAIRNDPALQALPVVMMTSRNSPDDIDRGLELGANAYVTKQEFDQGALISVIQQLI